MIEDGLFERFPCDRIYAMHNGPGLPVGKFAAVPGVRTAAGAFFDVTIQGKGGHGAYPHLAVDPIPITAELIGSLQTIVSRMISPNDSAVFSITKVHSGDAYNVIPDSACLSGTVRTFSMELMDKIEARVVALAKSVAEAYGASAEVSFRVLFHPVMNEAGATAFAEMFAARWWATAMWFAKAHREQGQKISLHDRESARVLRHHWKRRVQQFVT